MESLIRIVMFAAIFTITFGMIACDKGSEVPANASVPEDSASAGVAVKNAAESITITNAIIRATAPGQKVSGAFMILENTSETPYSLTSASFDAAGMVEIHETSEQGGLMRMRQVMQIDIPANGSVELKPGGYHIMLMGLEKALTAGTTETLTLVFSDNSQKTVAASVGAVSK